MIRFADLLCRPAISSEHGTTPARPPDALISAFMTYDAQGLPGPLSRVPPQRS